MKNLIIKFGFSIICLFCGNWALAQTTQIENPIIIPPVPQLGDSVFVRLRSATSGYTFSFGYVLRRSNDSFDISHCVRQTPVPEPRVFDDTVFLGVLDTGVYTIKFTIYETDNSDSCTYINPLDSTTVFKVSLPNGIQIGSRLQRLTVYPNPCKDYLYVEIAQSDYPTSITLYNQLGLAVSEWRFGSGESNGFKLEVSKLVMGIYFIEVVSDRAIVRRKIEIVR